MGDPKCRERTPEKRRVLTCQRQISLPCRRSMAATKSSKALATSLDFGVFALFHAQAPALANVDGLGANNLTNSCPRRRSAFVSFDHSIPRTELSASCSQILILNASIVAAKKCDYLSLLPPRHVSEIRRSSAFRVTTTRRLRFRTSSSALTIRSGRQRPEMPGPLQDLDF